MAPKVSVVMSVYNGERYLREAVESILVQTFTDFEFIIIDDGSTDTTWQILNSYDDPCIRLVRNADNMGLTKSLNKGLARARGAYVARQDADDASLPTRLERQVEYLDAHPEIGLLGTRHYVLDSKGRRRESHWPPLSDTEIRWWMLFHNAFVHTSVMLRRAVLDNAGLCYNEDLPYSQDYDLWARTLKHTSTANLQDHLVVLRFYHQSSVRATHFVEQQRIASEIAGRQIQQLQLACRLTPSEVETLRRWYHDFPPRLTKQDMELCGKLLRILDAFQQQPNIDFNVARGLRRHWHDRMLSAVSIKQARELWTSGLIVLLIRHDPALVVVHIVKSIIRKLKLLAQNLAKRLPGCISIRYGH